jgi:hypothetical protein
VGDAGCQLTDASHLLDTYQMAACMLELREQAALIELGLLQSLYCESQPQLKSGLFIGVVEQQSTIFPVFFVPKREPQQTGQLTATLIYANRLVVGTFLLAW